MPKPTRGVKKVKKVKVYALLVKDKNAFCGTTESSRRAVPIHKLHIFTTRGSAKEFVETREHTIATRIVPVEITFTIPTRKK